MYTAVIKNEHALDIDEVSILGSAPRMEKCDPAMLAWKGQVSDAYKLAAPAGIKLPWDRRSSPESMEVDNISESCTSRSDQEEDLTLPDCMEICNGLDGDSCDNTSHTTPVEHSAYLSQDDDGESHSSAEQQSWTAETEESPPPYTYAALIGMAILASPEHQQTVNQICEWIGAQFPYYRDQGVLISRKGKHNRIRSQITRVLDSDGAFAKSKIGRTNQWSIKPDLEYSHLQNELENLSRQFQSMDLASCVDSTDEQMQTEAKEPPASHICPSCPSVFTHSLDLDHHLMTIHSAELDGWRCEECGKVFARQKLLLQHAEERDHSPFKCGDCGARFGVLWKMVRHARKTGHTLSKRYAKEVLECGDCGNTYVGRNNLGQHVRGFCSGNTGGTS